METNIFLTGLIGFILILAFVVLIIYVIYKQGMKQKAQEAEYNSKYRKIQNMLREFMPNRKNQLKVKLMLIELQRLKHKNPEQTEVLQNNINIWMQNIDELLLKK